MRIVLLRHGESEGNLKRIYAGHLDVPLTERGRAQAEQAALFLGMYDFKTIYVSPLDRAYETAYLAGRLETAEVDIVKLDGLKEMSFGLCEGLTYQQIQSNYPNLAEELTYNHLMAQYPEGESLQGFYERVNACYQDILENIKQEDGDYLVAAHSGVIQCILAHELTGGSAFYWHFKLKNCGYAVLTYYGGFPILTELNNTISQMV